VTIILPPFVAIAAVLLLIYTWTGMFYRPSSRELRRLNNLLRSRIYEHFGESLSGLTTLKAFGALSRFVADNRRKIDAENTAYWLSVACQRWFNLRLDLCGATLVLVAGLLVVALRGTIDPSSGGVVLSYVVTAQVVFGNMIRQSAEIENNMNSVERLLHYVFNIENEPMHEVENVDKELIAKRWPSAGRVRFQSLTYSHRPGLEPSLRDVTLTIEPGEKIGVVGRTGAGKSTCKFPRSHPHSQPSRHSTATQITYCTIVISALLRLAEPTSGKILIDGIDIRTVGLHVLRCSLSVISQDAVMLAGTVRYNLDPLQQHDDTWLHECLVKVGLVNKSSNASRATSSDQDTKVKSEERDVEKENDSNYSNTPPSLTLDSEIRENGANISQGQRSLISMARALVRRSKIVILDEATASIDGKADMELQVMLKQVMGDATVITVAHRLDTIISTCSKVIVMDCGRVAEFGSVSELFRKQDGQFRALCDASNIII
jgi:ABC-type multidrug transport system fused ATPase/permease subunit